MTEPREHPDFGMLATHSEFKVNDCLTYLDNGIERQGTIVWVVEAHELPGGTHMPPHYIVERDGAGNSWPDTVFFGDVIIH